MIQSLERAFLILEILDDAGVDGMGAQDLARTVGLKFPTVHNFLKSLVQLGYVSQLSETSKYALGPKAFNIGRKNDNRKSFSEVARPLAEELNRTLDETVVVTFYSNRTWFTLFQCNSNKELVVNPRLPMTSNLYISATGRCILSSLPEHERKEYVKNQGFPGKDWGGIANDADLADVLRGIGKRGYEIYGEGKGTIGVAFPLHLPARGIDAALGVYLPELRFGGEHRRDIIEKLRKTAEAIRTICEI